MFSSEVFEPRLGLQRTIQGPHAAPGRGFGVQGLGLRVSDLGFRV